jgi:hypothetical protein
MAKRLYEEEPQVIRHFKDGVVMWAQVEEWSLCVEAVQEALENGFGPERIERWLEGVDYPRSVSAALQ